jgi:hypothetical protein
VNSHDLTGQAAARLLEWQLLERWKKRRRKESMNDNLTFGLTLTIVGAAGTMLSLWVLSLLTSALKKVFPVPHKKPTTGT